MQTPMRRPLVAANWKMNGTRAEATALVASIVAGIDESGPVEVALCPPFILIPLVAEKLAARQDIALGGQNLDRHRSGAYTGEVSGPMLRDYRCRYVIVGHSERRALYGEDDRLIAAKFGAALEADLTPILCVGETLAQRETGDTQTVVSHQIEAVFESHGVSAFANAVVAYEPVWAIGTGKTATPQQAQEVHHFIREKFAARHGVIADNLRIIYGGSVKANNAADLFEQADIDGGLIGGASLDTNEFLQICRAGG